MPLPGDLTTITVTGSYPNIAGQPQSGSVKFDPQQPIADSAGGVILTSAVLRQIYNGIMQPVVLPCTDNAGLNPTGFQFKITETINGNVRVWYTALPHTIGSSVDLSALSPSNNVLPVTVTGIDGGFSLTGEFPDGVVDGGNA